VQPVDARTDEERFDIERERRRVGVFLRHLRVGHAPPQASPWRINEKESTT